MDHRSKTSAFAILFNPLSQIWFVVPVSELLYLKSENGIDYCHDKVDLAKKDMAALSDDLNR